MLDVMVVAVLVAYVKLGDRAGAEQEYQILLTMDPEKARNLRAHID